MHLDSMIFRESEKRIYKRKKTEQKICEVIISKFQNLEILFDKKLK